MSGVQTALVIVGVVLATWVFCHAVDRGAAVVWEMGW